MRLEYFKTRTNNKQKVNEILENYIFDFDPTRKKSYIKVL